MGWLFPRSEQLCAVIDLGSNRIASAIAAIQPAAYEGECFAKPLRVLGFATGQSSGIFAGRVRNGHALEMAVRSVVAKAEAQAGVTVSRAFVTASIDSLNSHSFRASLPLGRNSADEQDFASVFAAALDHAENGGRLALHLLAAGYDVAGRAERNGDCLAGGTALSVDFHALTVAQATMNSISRCLNRCQLSLEMLVAAPYASALGVTAPEERDIGVCVIDFGASATSACLFRHGNLTAVETVNLGGAHITAEIARAFSLRRAEAEALKLRYGSVFDHIPDGAVLADSGGGAHEPLHKSQLAAIMRGRMVKILTALKEKLMTAGTGPADEIAVLCGGGAAIPGIAELASQILERQAQPAMPAELSGLKPDANLSALTGACLYLMSAPLPARNGIGFAAPGNDSYAGRISQWLRASF